MPDPVVQALIEARPDPFVLIDESYRIVAVNQRYASLYGLRPAQLIGFTCHEVSHHRATPCHEHGEACPHRSVMDSGTATEVVHVHYGCGSRQDVVRIQGYPVTLHGRRLLGESIQPLGTAGAARITPSALRGSSPAFAAALAQLSRASRFTLPVLLLGETGVGKELAARHLHEQSARATAPYVTVDCTTLTSTLAEDELFGHARGAYTGAMGTRAGLFEQAHGGTVFLDEVGELALPLQAKLLRVIESGELRRLGEGSPKRVDVRVVCATQRDLLAEVEAGRFRADLYYRIAGIRVRLPPLRERRDDIPALATHFVAEFCEQSREGVQFGPGALEWLARQHFPGNVRELRQLVMRAAAEACGQISVALLESLRETPSATVAVTGPPDAATGAGAPPVDLDAVLERHAGRRAAAAAALGVSERTLYRWLRRGRERSIAPRP